jgi:hypothetical protein
MTDFNAESFLEQTTGAAMATSMTVCPEGEYLARIGDEPDAVTATSIQGKKDPTKTYVQVTVLWEILDENLKATLKRTSIKVRDRFFVDIDPVTKLLAVGPDVNVTLGARREALGLNSDAPFSIGMMRGKGPAMVKVVNTTDERDKTRKYAEIARATRLA